MIISEWVLIQLTPQYNPLNNLEAFERAEYIHTLYITVFHCGKNQPKPFCITINAPVDKISGKVIQIREEMESIITDNKKSFLNIKHNDKDSEFFNTYVDKHMYSKVRYTINNRLKVNYAK